MKLAFPWACSRPFWGDCLRIKQKGKAKYEYRKEILS